MEVKNIRALLHESIENIQDNDFLIAIKDFVESSYSVSKEPILSDNQKRRIKESKVQIKAGKFLSNERADQLVSEILHVWDSRRNPEELNF